MIHYLPVRTGRLNLRVTPQVHRAVQRAAAAEGVTVSAWLARLATKAAVDGGYVEKERLMQEGAPAASANPRGDRHSALRGAR